ncbi:MAG: 30S ribosomal protein S4 [Desulfurococcales archaeon]|nr:30S ribosomal protein S4 [Desulfurococcales archaeon]
MGDPRKPRKKWEAPRHPWRREALIEEMKLLGEYGLRNKRELWIAKTIVRRFRHQARSILALPAEVREQVEKALLHRLYILGLLPENATLDDVLSLTVEDLLERRLQTLVYRKGLARTIYQARQLIVHGHIAIGGRRVTAPGYIVRRDEEDLIGYAPTSPFKKLAQEEV